jgi:quercetin dioxygenase-like cupin family protein
MYYRPTQRQHPRIICFRLGQHRCPGYCYRVRTFFRSQTATTDELECHVTTLNPGEASHPPHKHPEEEVIIIKEGTVEALVNGEKKKVGSGSVIFQASNQMHALRNAGKTPATYHVISWHSPGTMEK